MAWNRLSLRPALAIALICCGEGAIAQYEIAGNLGVAEAPSPDNPFRPAGFQAPETVDRPETSPSDGAAEGENSPFKPIGRIGVEIVPGLEGARPEGATIGEEDGGAPVTTALMRPWPTMSYRWVAAATRHNPLYFEEINAERYGYTCSPCLQPAISVAHFFGTIPALPYLKGADCCWECQYTLGHHRPGSCNPWQTHYWPVSARGALCQAGVVTGISFLP